jgi:hypothetical protein
MGATEGKTWGGIFSKKKATIFLSCDWHIVWEWQGLWEQVHLREERVIRWRFAWS